MIYPLLLIGKSKCRNDEPFVGGETILIIGSQVTVVVTVMVDKISKFWSIPTINTYKT